MRPGHTQEARVPLRRVALFLLIAAGGLSADLATKHWTFQQLPSHGGVLWLWEGYVGLQKSLNEGALFGVGQGLVALYAVLSVVAAVAIPVWLFWAGAASDRVLCVALAMIMAGVLGNLYDRLGLHGLEWNVPGRAGQPVYAVRDFVLVQASDRLRWPNFNVADSLLVCGAGLLVWRSVREPRASAADRDPPNSASKNRH